MTTCCDRPHRLWASVLIALALSGGGVLAQMGGAPGAGFNVALTKLFDRTPAFTARCEVRMLDASQKDKLTMPMEFSLLDGKVRAEIDMTQIKGQGMTPQLAAQLKRMGMERIISVMRPDKKTLNLVYPAVQSCVTMPMPPEAVATNGVAPKTERTVMGKEMLDGHVCEKAKVILTEAGGKRFEVFVWNATDQQSFPLRIQTTEKGETVILHYTNIRFAKPDARLFELPAGYTSYSSVEAFILGVMKKMMGGAAKK